MSIKKKTINTDRPLVTLLKYKILLTVPFKIKTTLHYLKFNKLILPSLTYL